MSKERLKEIKEKTRSIAEPMLYIDWDDVKWLIKQAERVEVLIKAHELKDLEHQGLVTQLKKKEKQNKRYLEAIQNAFF